MTALKERLHILFVGILIVVMVVTPLRPALAAPRHQAAGGVTVGAIIASAILAKALIPGLIDEVGDEAKEILEEVDKTLTGLIEELGKTYGEMLDVTLDQLDEFTRDKLLELYSFVQRVQADLEVGVDNLNETILEDLQIATNNVRQIVSQIEDVFVVAFRGSLLIVRETAFVTAFIVDLVLLGLGLIVFIWLLFTRRLPTQPTSRRLALAGMGLFLAVFGTLILPAPRAYALTWTSLGTVANEITEVRIFDVHPDALVIGKTQEIRLIGARMVPGGEPPTVEIAGQEAPVTASGNEIVAVNVAGLDLGDKTGTQTVSLRTADDQVATSAITIRIPRPLPRVTAWTITPVGKMWESGGHNTRTNVGCKAPKREIGKTEACEFEEEIVVDPGYVLDLNIPVQLGEKSEGDVMANPGNANGGFRETITTYKRREGEPRDPQRRIDFIRNSVTGEPLGIRVSGSARNDTGQRIGGKRGEFRATYTVYGRRATQGAGTSWTFQGSCEISGTVVCGSYNVPEDFIDAPDYLVDVTFTGAEGQTASKSGSLIANNPASQISVVLRYEDTDGQLRSTTVALRILERLSTAFVERTIRLPFGRERIIRIPRNVRQAEVQVAGPDLGSTPSPIIAPYLRETLPGSPLWRRTR